MGVVPGSLKGPAVAPRSSRGSSNGALLPLLHRHFDQRVSDTDDVLAVIHARQAALRRFSEVSCLCRGGGSMIQVSVGMEQWSHFALSWFPMERSISDLL